MTTPPSSEPQATSRPAASETPSVLHVTPNLGGTSGGGVSAYLRELVRQTAGEARHTAAGLLNDGPTSLPGAERVLEFPRRGPAMLGYAPQLAEALDQWTAPVDVVHTHGLRMLPMRTGRRFAERRRLPLVISPHGQLDPWVLEDRRVRKLVVDLLWERKNLRTAACFHATAPQEARHIRQAGLRAPIAISRIGIHADRFTLEPDRDVLAEDVPAAKDHRLMLYLTTIYPKKNLPALARAWARLAPRFRDWHLVVAGREMCDDADTARASLAAAGLADRATFLGPVSDEVRHRLLPGAEVYVLPTRGENFAISVGESLASGTPVIVTNTTPWKDIERHRCGWWIDPGDDPLVRAMERAMQLDDAERREMGRRGRELIERAYRWDEVGRAMVELYQWLRDGGSKPAFVYRHDETLPPD